MGAGEENSGMPADWEIPANLQPDPNDYPYDLDRTLSAVVAYALCGGQRSLSQLGYAPLPRVLVRGGLIQAANIPGHGPIPTPAHCH